MRLWRATSDPLLTVGPWPLGQRPSFELTPQKTQIMITNSVFTRGLFGLAPLAFAALALSAKTTASSCPAHKNQESLLWLWLWLGYGNGVNGYGGYGYGYSGYFQIELGPGIMAYGTMAYATQHSTVSESTTFLTHPRNTTRPRNAPQHAMCYLLWIKDFEVWLDSAKYLARLAGRPRPCACPCVRSNRCRSRGDRDSQSLKLLTQAYSSWLLPLDPGIVTSARGLQQHQVTQRPVQV